ncbi:protein stoned-B [Papilio machaon]|uniref:protein stoned-B n=1 Tax=Papilio machaon TaxID=76193 RepID=UPI001E663CEF|nr:protein stoned-B [Papilio machaon]
MLKLPKGLKKKKKGKKSKRKGEEELFTEEELEKYRREHQQQQTESGDTAVKENEEWSKFKDLTTGIDSVLKKTQGDLDRIKSTSFFQRVQPKEEEPQIKEAPTRPVVEVTEADFPQLLQTTTDADEDKSDYGLTDEESEEEEQDDIFDTSYVEAVERGEVKLAYVPDSPEEFQDDGLFDTSHVEALIKGQDIKSKGDKKTLDIGVAVEVLTGRIDNLTVTSKKRKRIIPGDLLLESVDSELPVVAKTTENEPIESSILDADTDIPITTPIDLSVSLHTSLLQQNKSISKESISDPASGDTKKTKTDEDEDDEFTLLATESLETKPQVIKLEEKEIKVEPVIKESWSAFEADKNESVFAEGIVEDQIEILDPYLDQDDPFDTSFADSVIPTTQSVKIESKPTILEDDEDFDPRAEEVREKLNNRRKSSVRIHLTNPLGVRESITSDDIIETDVNKVPRDLLGGSSTDLSQLGDSPLDPLDANNSDIDPFDTTIVDKVVAPGRVELKLLEQELIGATQSVIYRVPSDPDFDPRADEPKQQERRASRPENLTVSKSVVFNVDGVESTNLDSKSKPIKPLTPYYTKELSITEDISETGELIDKVSEQLSRTRSDEDLSNNIKYVTKRRHSEYPQLKGTKNNFDATDLFNTGNFDIQAKVLLPSGLKLEKDNVQEVEEDPFDTSFASDIKPSKTELKLLAKEFDVEDSKVISESEGDHDFLETSDDIFQVKALTPQPVGLTQSQEDFDPFDTSFATALNPGKTELNMNEPSAPATADVLNPFMMADIESSALTGDNPFVASNPFSDFGENYEPPVGDTVPVDIFGGESPTNLGAKNFENNPMDMFIGQQSDSEKFTKPTELDLVSTIVDSPSPTVGETCNREPPTHSLPPETQNLILSVTGQMEFTSSHLLDRIPPTRTPSPVSVRDIHSPSPTPDPDSHEEGATIENVDDSKNKPARPPPARPPRPAPPSVVPPRPQAPPCAVPPRPEAPPSVGEPRQVMPSDDINLFDAPVPVVTKPTKEDILSLYSAPKKEEKQIDFLSGDLEDMHSDSCTEIQPSMKSMITTINSNTSMFQHNIVSTDNVMDETAIPMDCSEPMDISQTNTSPFMEDIDEKFQELTELEKNPFDTDDQIDDDLPSFGNGVSDIFSSQPEDAFMSSSTEAQENQNEAVVQAQPTEQFPEAEHKIFVESHGGTVVNEDIAFNTDSSYGGNNTGVPSTSDLGWDTSETIVQESGQPSEDAFDAFSAKFESATPSHMHTDAWGDNGGAEAAPSGFEAEAFDPFLSLQAPPPAATPCLDRQGSRDSADDTFTVFIRPKDDTAGAESAVPVLAPPPRPHALPESPRTNPFDKGEAELQTGIDTQFEDSRRRSGGGGETPPTPLFDEDVSAPLEDFPRTTYTGPGWEMHLRQPNKKKITGQRFWKKMFVRLVYVGESPAVQLLGSATDKEPLQELPLQACYSVSDVGAQQFDQFGKIFTVKLQYVFYKERPGVRPGQVTKAERITSKLSQFAAYAMQGDYQGVKEFGSDLRKLGLPVEHAPQVSQLFKLGSLSYEDVKQFSCCVEEALFRLPAHRDRALTYKMEEVQLTAVDELHVEQDAEGGVLKQIARVRIFFLGFLSGMPDVEVGLNDLRRQGREVVGRHDIIPVATEEWIRVENAEFHACVQPQEFAESQILKFKPPDACYIELMRFRVRPPKNRELPLQLKAAWCVAGNKVELRADVLVPGFASRALGQVPCEDVAIRFPIPECWIYLFRVEKHFRYGSVKSAHRRTGKIKGIERFLGAVDTLQESLIEVTSGQAKYEHQHRAIVWRMPRLPKEGQGAYTTHNLVCRMALTSYDQVPPELAPHAFVEFTMPAAQVSHTTVRSVSLQNHDADPPEKYVRYLARHEYIVGIERTSGQAAPAYALAAAAPPTASPAAAPAVPERAPSSDSDSD